MYIMILLSFIVDAIDGTVVLFDIILVVLIIITKSAVVALSLLSQLLFSVLGTVHPNYSFIQ